MRRKLFSVVAAAAFAVALAGCGGDTDADAGATPEPTASAPAGPTDPADTADADAAAATRQACDTAVPVTEENAAKIEEDFQKLIAAVIDGGPAAETAEADLRAKLAGWAGMLESLAVDPVEADVQQALNETAEFVTQINDPDDNTPMGQVQGQLTELAGNLKAACE
jgi:hypothetical protein